MRDWEDERERCRHQQDGEPVALPRQPRTEDQEHDEACSRQRRQHPRLLHAESGDVPAPGYVLLAHPCADLHHQRSASTSSTFDVPRFRNTRSTTASASPTSAAAIVITKIAKMIP